MTSKLIMIQKLETRTLNLKPSEIGHVNSDGHDKLFCAKAITMIDNIKKSLAILIIIDKFFR